MEMFFFYIAASDYRTFIWRRQIESGKIIANNGGNTYASTFSSPIVIVIWLSPFFVCMWRIVRKWQNMSEFICRLHTKSKLNENWNGRCELCFMIYGCCCHPATFYLFTSNIAYLFVSCSLFVRRNLQCCHRRRLPFSTKVFPKCLSCTRVIWAPTDVYAVYFHLALRNLRVKRTSINNKRIVFFSRKYSMMRLISNLS